ncbi:MAG: hypothetical protein WD342_02450 [Verrucomicrobiales bacterium]
MAALLGASCQVQPYMPPPQKALVESVEVEIRDFQGRPDAFAVVKGRLSSNAAQLVDHQQSREDGRLYLEVLEQTPRGASLLPNLTEGAPFQARIPIELLGLEPGVHALSANGVETTFELDPVHAQFLSEVNPASANAAPDEPLKDELVPIEETVWGSPATTETSAESPLKSE